MGIEDLAFEKGKVEQPLANSDRDALLGELPGWRFVAEPQPSIEARFACKNFVAALELANKIGEVAEQYNHHPEITVTYGAVKVSWWTHTAGGVAANDCFMAKRTSELYDP